MNAKELTFTSIHEAGHLVCVEHFPPARTGGPFYHPGDRLPRTYNIEIWYDQQHGRYDGRTPYSNSGLSEDQLLFIASGGPIAELIARNNGNWNSEIIQAQLFSGKRDDTQDMDDIRRYLDRLSKDRSREEITTALVSYVCSDLKKSWDLILQVADEVQRSYDKSTNTANLLYSKLLPETQDCLDLLKGTFQSYL